METFNLATNQVFLEITETDPNFDFYNELKHNNEVFSAFKAHRAQNDIAAQMIDSNGVLKPFEQFSKDVQPIVSHHCETWLKTEYNTAVLRAGLARDWKQFERDEEYLPNLEWAPSLSPNPGADHMIYWGTILSLRHPFWTKHRPGDRWNCKCGLRSTDEPETGVPQDPEQLMEPSPGLDNNPVNDGKLFSDTHPYYTNSAKGASKAVKNFLGSKNR